MKSIACKEGQSIYSTRNKEKFNIHEEEVLLVDAGLLVYYLVAERSHQCEHCTAQYDPFVAVQSSLPQNNSAVKHPSHSIPPLAVGMSQTDTTQTAPCMHAGWGCPLVKKEHDAMCSSPSLRFHYVVLISKMWKKQHPELFVVLVARPYYHSPLECPLVYAH